MYINGDKIQSIVQVYKKKRTKINLPENFISLSGIEATFIKLDDKRGIRIFSIQTIKCQK